MSVIWFDSRTSRHVSNGSSFSECNSKIPPPLLDFINSVTFNGDTVCFVGRERRILKYYWSAGPYTFCCFLYKHLNRIKNVKISIIAPKSWYAILCSDSRSHYDGSIVYLQRLRLLIQSFLRSFIRSYRWYTHIYFDKSQNTNWTRSLFHLSFSAFCRTSRNSNYLEINAN